MVADTAPILLLPSSTPNVDNMRTLIGRWPLIQCLAMFPSTWKTSILEAGWNPISCQPYSTQSLAEGCLNPCQLHGRFSVRYLLSGLPLSLNSVIMSSSFRIYLRDNLTPLEQDWQRCHPFSTKLNFLLTGSENHVHNMVLVLEHTMKQFKLMYVRKWTTKKRGS